MDTQLQLVQVEGFSNVVNGSCFKALDSVNLFSLFGQADDWNMAGLKGVMQLPADLKAVYIG
jgi:hypothetical protein